MGGATSTARSAAHEEARQRLTDPEEIAAIDARRATLLAGAGRPAEALRIADSVGIPASARTRVELAAARATSLLSLGRCDEAIVLSRRAAAEQADLPGWLARRGIALHVVNEAHALGLQRALLGRSGDARARPRAGPGHERRRRFGVVRDGAR